MVKKSHARWICGKPSHFKNNCTIWKKKLSNKKTQGRKGEASQSQDNQGNSCAQNIFKLFMDYVCMIS